MNKKIITLWGLDVVLAIIAAFIFIGPPQVDVYLYTEDVCIETRLEVRGIEKCTTRDKEYWSWGPLINLERIGANACLSSTSKVKFFIHFSERVGYGFESESFCYSELTPPSVDQQIKDG